MIERYTLPEMGAIWTDQAKYQSWLDVEVAACEANCSLGRVPDLKLVPIWGRKEATSYCSHCRTTLWPDAWVDAQAKNDSPCPLILVPT